MLARLKNEPAILIGALAAAAMALVQSLGGNGIIGQDAVDTVASALNPTSGWALPIVIGFITRFFVSPAGKPGL